MSENKNLKPILIAGGVLGCGCLGALGIVFIALPILAAVVLPRLIDTTEADERRLAQDLIAQLNSAAAMYTVKQMKSPERFTDFVTAEDIPPGSSYTLSTRNLGLDGCQVTERVIDCSPAFTTIEAKYFWDRGAITFKINPR